MSSGMTFMRKISLSTLLRGSERSTANHTSGGSRIFLSGWGLYENERNWAKGASFGSASALYLKFSVAMETDLVELSQSVVVLFASCNTCYLLSLLPVRVCRLATTSVCSPFQPIRRRGIHPTGRCRRSMRERHLRWVAPPTSCSSRSKSKSTSGYGWLKVSRIKLSEFHWNGRHWVI